MRLGTNFKLSLYGLIAIVGVILGAAEGEGATLGKARSELYLPYLSVPAAICGFYFTERLSKGLGSLWANALGLVALLATAYQFNSENREGKLLAGTHLLLYVTWIVLFQRKTVRSYWFLMALGILQLAIASVLTRSGWFGFSAIGYTFAAVWTLSIFSLWRAEQSFLESERRTGDFGELRAAWSVSEVRSSVQHEEGTKWLTARFGTGVLTMTLSALVISAVFFAFIPRVWVGPEFNVHEDRGGGERPSSRTVMASTVRLGDLGALLASKERVFEIQLTDLHTQQRISVQAYAEQLGLAEPLFRGMVLSKYEAGRWTSNNRIDSLDGRSWRDDAHHDIRQDIRLEQVSTRHLYHLGKPLDVIDAEKRAIGNYHAASGVLFRDEVGAIDYSVFSEWPEQPQTNFKLKSRPRRPWGSSSNTLQQYLEVPEGLTELRQLAAQIVKNERARRERVKAARTDLTPLEVAEAIEFYLRDSGEFQYSIDLSLKDPNRDPVEDFLFNRKTGHCEYFASTLALMLRSVKIPARVVSGYKGGIEHADRRNYSFEVQQRFAHLWVEAWVDKEDSAWVTFDATPEAPRAEGLANSDQSRPSVWSNMQSTFSGIWSENVLNMSLDRQEQSIYKPLRELGYALLTFFRQLFTSPKLALDTLRELFENREQWFSLGGGLVAFGILLSLAGIVWISRVAGRRLIRWLAERRTPQENRQRQIVEFYERFTNLMHARGLRREHGQTQLEFAEQVATSCERELTAHHLRNVPTEISDKFYRVRFGDQQLSKEDLNELEASLANLELALSSAAKQG